MHQVASGTCVEDFKYVSPPKVCLQPTKVLVPAYVDCNTDFTIFQWEKDDTLHRLADVAWEGILRSKQYDVLESLKFSRQIIRTKRYKP